MNVRGVEARGNSIRLAFMWRGKRVRETLRWPPTPANLARAERLLSDVRAAIRNGVYDPAAFFPNSRSVLKMGTNVLKLGTLCDDWLETKGRLAPATLSQYRNACRVWKELIGADRPVAEISLIEIEKIIGSHPWKSVKLLNNYLITLRGVFSLAVRSGVLLENPARDVRNSRPQKKAPDPLTLDERDRVLAWLRERKDPRVHAYFMWQFATGMRPEETIALRWDDVDFAHGSVRVERAKTHRGQLKGTKTGTIRDVDLVPDALEALEIMKPFTRLKSDFIFENPRTKRPWHDDRAQRDWAWNPALKALGIRYRRAYATRHTYATAALMGGVTPAYIARQLGHTSPGMVYRVYAKWIDGADAGRERTRLAAAFAPSPAPDQGPRVDRQSDAGGRRDWIRTNAPPSRAKRSRGGG